MPETNFDRSTGIRGPLYDLLLERLPLYCGKNGLQIYRMAPAMDMTTEGIYRWLRSGKLTVNGAIRFAQISNDPANRKMLKKGVDPARTEDFLPFVFV